MPYNNKIRTDIDKSNFHHYNSYVIPIFKKPTNRFNQLNKNSIDTYISRSKLFEIISTTKYSDQDNKLYIDLNRLGLNFYYYDEVLMRFLFLELFQVLEKSIGCISFYISGFNNTAFCKKPSKAVFKDNLTNDLSNTLEGNGFNNVTKDQNDYQRDYYGNELFLFPLNINEKFELWGKELENLFKFLDQYGIKYEVAYNPFGFIPHYIKNISLNAYYPYSNYSNGKTSFDLGHFDIFKNVRSNSSSMYCYNNRNVNDYEDKYKKDFPLINDNHNYNIIHNDTLIEFMQFQLYSDYRKMKETIKRINPTVQFGICYDLYLTTGNITDKNLANYNPLYGPFQKEIMFPKELCNPFADFIRVEGLDYDYRLLCGNNSNIILFKDNVNYVGRYDIRTINERIYSVIEPLNYTLDHTEVLFNNDKFILPSITKRISRENDYKNILYEKHLRMNTSSNNVYPININVPQYMDCSTLDEVRSTIVLNSRYYSNNSLTSNELSFNKIYNGNTNGAVFDNYSILPLYRM